MAKLHQDFTQGNIKSLILRFSWPFLLSNILQALYGAVDMLIVGNFSSGIPALRDAALSGVQIGSQITFIITMLVSGLTIGGTVMVGQYYGAHKDEDMRSTIGTLFSLLTLLGIGITAVMLVLCDPLLRLLQTPMESFQYASDYLRICLYGILLIFGYNAISSVQRGMGDSKRPLLFVAVACLSNIILDYLFVAKAAMGPAGAAWATVISQGLSLLLAAVYLARNQFVFDFKLKSFKIHMSKLRLMFRIGIPSSVQSLFVNLSFLIMTALVNSISYQASAAVGIVGRFNSFAILPAIAMSSSVSAFTAQNFGAGYHDRIRQGLKVASVMAFGLGIAIFAIAQLFPRQILSMFTVSADTVENGVAYIRTLSFDYLLVPFLFCINGVIMGSGHTTITMITAFVSSIFLRIPAAYLLSRTEMGLAGIGAAAPIASIAALALAVWFYITSRWLRNTTGIRRTESMQTEMALGEEPLI
jgi:putative MATE family efflux protein